MAGDEKLQQFLNWVDEKARSVDVRDKPAAIRAFYFLLDLSRVLSRALDLALALALNLSRALALDLALDLSLNRALNCFLDLELDLDFDLDLNVALDHALKVAGRRDPELKHKLDILSSQLPNLEDARELQIQWWQENGYAWENQLLAVMIEHRNIGHDWQFSAEQQKRLLQYYDANKLLVDCLNSDCYITRSVREEIEATLLLPIAEIKQQQPLEKPE